MEDPKEETHLAFGFASYVLQVSLENVSQIVPWIPTFANGCVIALHQQIQKWQHVFVAGPPLLRDQFNQNRQVAQENQPTLDVRPRSTQSGKQEGDFGAQLVFVPLQGVQEDVESTVEDQLIEGVGIVP